MTVRTILATGLLALLALEVRGDDWTQWGLSPDRARLPSEQIDSPRPLGSVDTGIATLASPVAADGFLVTAGLDGTVRGFGESDLTPLWSRALGAPVLATPLLSRGRVYLPCTDGTLYILRLSDGTTLGKVDTGGADQSSPLLSGNLLIFASGFPNASLLAVDTASGSVAWRTPFPESINSSPVLARGQLVVATTSGTLVAVDPASGAALWTTTVAGRPGAGAPLIWGGSVFILAGATLSRVGLDPAKWGSNAALVLPDLRPAPAGALSTEWACSSLALAGGRVTGLVRFDYPLDLDGDGFVDRWTLREYAFAVDPLSLATVWQQPLGEVTVENLHAIPPLRLVPAPVSTGSGLAVASSVGASLKLLSLASGAESSSFALDSPCQASPFVANSRLYAMSRAGVLHAFEGSSAQPGPASGLRPGGVELRAGPRTLSWDAAGGGVTYQVRLARGGDILMDWDAAWVVSANSVPCPRLARGFVYTWGVRVRSPSGAYGPWSLASFGKAPPPEPAGRLTAVPKHQKVLLSWDPSPSAGVVGYRLSYGETGGPMGPGADLGKVTSTTVSALTNGTSYTFELRAVDALGFAAAPVTAVSSPRSLISIGSASYETLPEALAAVLPGQAVQLGEDTFPVSTTLRLPPGASLRGLNGLATRLEGTAPIVMIDAGQGTSVQLLSLSSGSTGVRVSSTGVRIANCVIRSMSDSGIFVDGSTDVISNTIVNNANFGIRSAGLVIARNNVIQGNGVGLAGVVVSTYNDVSDGYALCAPGAGDRSLPIAFLDPAAGDYREQPHQASLDAGAPSDNYSQEPEPNGRRINLGAFGNTPFAAGSPDSVGPSTSGSTGQGCGLTGVEVMVLLCLRRRRGRPPRREVLGPRS